MRFAGEMLDSTGLYHLRARSYDPDLGRFLQLEPRTPETGAPQPSAYLYVTARPTVFVDPSGEAYAAPNHKCTPDGRCGGGGTGTGTGRGTPGTTGPPFNGWTAQTGRVYGQGAVARPPGPVLRAARRAANEVPLGEGGNWGTKVHSQFARNVNGLNRADLKAEVSYRNGKVEPWGTPGSIRVDVRLGSDLRPRAIFDLKTGNARLTPARVQRIRDHLPKAFKDIPIIEIRIVVS